MMEEEAIIKIEVGNVEFYLSNGYYFHEFFYGWRHGSLEFGIINFQSAATGSVNSI